MLKTLKNIVNKQKSKNKKRFALAKRAKQVEAEDEGEANSAEAEEATIHTLNADHGSNEMDTANLTKKRKSAATSISKVPVKRAKVNSKPAAPSVYSAAAAAREPLMLGFASRAQAHASLAPSSLDQEANLSD